MAKQAEDTVTAELSLPDAPRRRGRPSTGKAMTPAERKRAQRRRALDYGFSHFEREAGVSLSSAPVSTLLERLGQFVGKGWTDEARRLADELVRRASAAEPHDYRS